MNDHARRIAFFLVGMSMALCLYSRFADSQWDLSAYLRAADKVRRGLIPYTFQDEGAPIHVTNLTVYVYPPLFARILAPFTLLPDGVIRFGWMLIQAVAFESLYWIGLRLFGRSFTPASWIGFHLLGLRYDGVMTDFRAGNTALMEAAILTAWAQTRLARPYLGGGMLGCLTAVKPFTVFALVWDIIARRWKPLGAAMAASALLYLGMVLDWSNFIQYRIFLKSPTFQRIMEEHTVGIYNSATVSVAFRLFTDQTLFKPILVYPPLAYAMTFGIPVAAWFAVFALWRRAKEAGLSEADQNRLGFLTLLPTVLLTIPRVADYTLVWLLVPLFFGAWWCWEQGRRWALALFLLAAIIGNISIKPSDLEEMTYPFHLLHHRYLSLVLFWWAGWALARAASGRRAELAVQGHIP
ncbi:MAG: hypothetical protein GHCLOJNM_00846 [bacterium]|nr:hypothetical protein [bacterium]